MSEEARIIAGSGRIVISLSGKTVVSISLSENRLSISIDDGTLRTAVRRFGLSVNAINLLGKVSEALYKIGAAVEIRDSSGVLIQLGAGAYTPTAKLKANLAKLLLLLIG